MSNAIKSCGPVADIYNLDVTINAKIELLPTTAHRNFRSILRPLQDGSGDSSQKLLPILRCCIPQLADTPLS